MHARRSRFSPCFLALTGLLLLLATTEGLHSQAPGAADDLPRVHVLATGGTISNTSGDRLTGEELVASLPGIERFARVTVEQFSNVASGAISLEQWLAMSRRIDELFREPDAPAGIVVTHGTDTMEETAWFLDLTLGHCRPVVVTGAMRRADTLGSDGPANLFSSIRVAADPAASRIGAVVVMNDDIFAGRDVAKIHASRPDAFISSTGERVGLTGPDGVIITRSTRDPGECGAPRFSLEGVESLPRVDLVVTYLGADGALIRAAAEAGARGIVIAAVGRGGSTPGQRGAIQEVRAGGTVVAVSTRTGAGRVPTGVRGGGGAAMVGAGDLTPVKARILLMLALTRTEDPTELAEIFATH